MTASDDVSGTRGLSPTLSRYDVLLAAIPLAFGLALVAGRCFRSGPAPRCRWRASSARSSSPTACS